MSVELRPYQRDAYDRILGEFARGVNSTLLVLPTGCGKTITFGSVAKTVVEGGDRVLILAHRGELIDQAADSLAAIGVEAAVEMADRVARASLWGEPSCVVASVQTMQRNRLHSWPKGHFKLVITDEAHHSTAGSYEAVYRHLEPEWHLGVTATADRLDGENLGQVYGSVAYEYTLRDAIEQGWLSRLQVIRCRTDVDLSAIRTTGGDLNQGDIEKAIQPHVEELANAYVKEAGERRGIVFTPDVGSAQAFASAFTNLGCKAESISGDCRDRADILDRFRKGATRILVNCSLLTEGFDAPFVSAIGLLRPTKSRSLFAQMIGRGTRRAPNKEDCRIVDFAWLTGKHKLVSPVELFGPTIEPEAAKLVASMVESGESADLMEAIERAESEVRERRKIHVEARRRDVKYGRYSYDPFGDSKSAVAIGLPTRRESDYDLRCRPSPAQVAYLERLGVPDGDKMSRRRASQMIDVLKGRINKGLASLKQVDFAIRLGMDPAQARNMKFADAPAVIDGLKRGYAS